MEGMVGQAWRLVLAICDMAYNYRKGTLNVSRLPVEILARDHAATGRLGKPQPVNVLLE